MHDGMTKSSRSVGIFQKLHLIVLQSVRIKRKVANIVYMTSNGTDNSGPQWWNKRIGFST